MKLIAKNTDYAIRALCFMAKQGERVYSASELSTELKTPKPFLRAILQTLSNERILTSSKGRRGGFKLAMPGDRIFIADLRRIFQGPIELTSCFIKKDLCSDIEGCPLREKIDKIARYINSEFESLTIGSLIEDELQSENRSYRQNYEKDVPLPLHMLEKREQQDTPEV